MPQELINMSRRGYKRSRIALTQAAVTEATVVMAAEEATGLAGMAEEATAVPAATTATKAQEPVSEQALCITSDKTQSRARAWTAGPRAPGTEIVVALGSVDLASAVAEEALLALASMTDSVTLAELSLSTTARRMTVMAQLSTTSETITSRILDLIIKVEVEASVLN